MATVLAEEGAQRVEAKGLAVEVKVMPLVTPPDGGIIDITSVSGVGHDARQVSPDTGSTRIAPESGV